MGINSSKDVAWALSPPGEVNKSQFIFKCVIGKGSFGFVWKAEKRSTKQIYAIRTMNKALIYNKRSIDTILNEMRLLTSLKHPFIVNMQYAFQETNNLYFVTEFQAGGDLNYHITHKKKKFSEKEATFIIACCILALEYLHNNGVIHRDLRPENIFIDSKGYCKVADFGLSRIWQPQNSSDISGTPGYMAPEVLLRQNHGMGVDYFALGVIAHELMLGVRPYAGDTRSSYKESIMTEQIVLKKADTPETWNHEASDFINKCIQRKPTSRLGLNGPLEIKSHVWFRDFEWNNLLSRKMESPFIPNPRKNNFEKKDFILKPDEQLNHYQEEQNQKLMRKNSFQRLFDDFKYDVEFEKQKEMEKEENAKKKRNKNQQAYE